MNNIGNGRKILIVDDDADLSMIIRDLFTDYGYAVTLAASSEEAYELLGTNSYHVIILDINLPTESGFEVCRQLRSISTVPVIFASARTSEDDKIKGLDIGGDDYLSKPYSLKELLSRTNSLIRRTYGYTAADHHFILGKGTDNCIEISTAGRCVYRNHQPVSLALKEYDLLLFMAEHMGQALSKEQLLQAVWGMFSEVEMSTLTVHIRWLRQKLEKDASNPQYIKTMWGVGYMLSDE